MSVSFTTTIGLIAGVCTTGSILPQVIKALKTRHTRDISLLMYIFLTLGILLWLIYGFMLHEMPIILANGTSLILTTSVLVLKVKHG
jgi:MtN3 and saliva related transmembrane protein